MIPEIERAMAEAARDPADFEAAVIREVRERMVGRRPFFASAIRDHVWIDDVRVDGVHPDSTLEIFLRDDRRSTCRFVRRDPIWERPMFELGSDPASFVRFIGISLSEEIDGERYGLSTECEPGAVVPVGNRVVSLDEVSSLAAFRVLAPAEVPAAAELVVTYEPNREFGSHQSVTLHYRWRDADIVVEQSANFRTGLPEQGWEVVERDGWPITVWRFETLSRLMIGLRFEDSEVHLHSTTLDEERLLTIARSLRPTEPSP